MRTLFVVACLFLVCGCAVFQPVGENLGRGAIGGLQEGADSLGGLFGGGLMTGLRDSLTGLQSRQQLAALVQMLGDSLNAEVRALRDSLFGEYLRLWVQEIRNDLVGAQTRSQLAALRDELLGAATRKQLGALRSELLGDSMRAQVGELRDELLGPATRAAVDSLVNDAIESIAKGYRERIRPIAREEESWLRRNVTEVLIVVGLIIAGLIVLGGYVYIQKQRYRRIVGVVATEIEAFPDKKAHDELTKKISQKAIQEGVEQDLRAVLRDEGIVKKTK